MTEEELCGGRAAKKPLNQMYLFLKGNKCMVFGSQHCQNKSKTNSTAQYITCVV